MATVTPPVARQKPSNVNYLETVAQFGQALSSITSLSYSGQFLQDAIKLVADSFGFSYVNLFWTRGKSKTIVLEAAQWQGKQPSAMEKDSLTEATAAPGNIVHTALTEDVPLTRHRPNYSKPAPIDAIIDEIAVPLPRQDGKSAGLLYLFSDTPDELDAQSLSLISVIAGQLALAIENTQLRRTATRKSYEQKILLDMNTALSSQKEINRALQLVAKKITSVLKAGACTVSRYNKDAQTLTAIVEHIESIEDAPARTWRNLNEPIPLKQDAIGRQVLQTMRPVAIQTQNLQTESARAQRWTRYGWNSILAFPLQTGNQKLGLIEVYAHAASRVFHPEDIQLGRALAGQATIAIGQADLLQQTQQRLAEVSTFYTLSQQIISSSSLQLNDLLESVVSTLKDIVDCRACVLFLLDESGQYLEIKAAAGMRNRWREVARLAIGEGAAGQSVSQRKAVYVSDTTQDPNFIFFDQSIRSLIVVPMIYQDKVIGAINLDDTRPNAFGKSQETLLTIAANQAAIAIQNATLFDKVLSDEQRTRAIIQHMADGILLLNPTGDIVNVNPALGHMLGMHPVEIVGQNTNDKHLDPRLKPILLPLNPSKHTGALAEEVSLPGKTPTILRVFATAVTNEAGQVTGEVRVVHDVTQERELERMKDDFIATVSHELRTPLFSIQGFVRLILDGNVPNPHTQQEFLTIIERQANQLAELVTNLIDLNKISSSELEIQTEPVQLVDVLNQTILKLQGFAHNKKVHLSGSLPPSLPTIIGDGQRLEQVVTNLIGNAIKFTPVDGKVLVRAHHNHKYVIMSVADTGIGIDPKDLNKVFRKFYQVEEHSTRSVEGSGLGLHIAKLLVEQHNGRIWTKSQPGKGSIFYVQLPIAGTRELSDATADEDSDSVST